MSIEFCINFLRFFRSFPQGERNIQSLFRGRVRKIRRHGLFGTRTRAAALRTAAERLVCPVVWLLWMMIFWCEVKGLGGDGSGGKGAVGRWRGVGGARRERCLWLMLWKLQQWVAEGWTEVEGRKMGDCCKNYIRKVEQKYCFFMSVMLYWK